LSTFTQGIVPGDVTEKVQDQVVTSPDQSMSAANQATEQDRFTREVPIYSGHRPSRAGCWAYKP
jgi:hypothetical protein